MDISFIPKEVMLAWGIPGTLLLVAVGIIVFLFTKLTESQEKRVEESIATTMKYEELLSKVDNTMNRVLDVLKEFSDGK